MAHRHHRRLRGLPTLRLVKNLFVPPRGYSPARLWFYAALLAVLASLAVPWSGLDDGIPDRASLSTATGVATWIEEYRHGVRFRLSGHAQMFDHTASGEARQTTARALEQSAGQQLTVRYEPVPRTPMAGGEFFDVWEIGSHDRAIRSWAEATQAQRDNTAIRPWLAAIAALLAVYFGFLARRAGLAARWLL